MELGTLYHPDLTFPEHHIPGHNHKLNGVDLRLDLYNHRTYILWMSFREKINNCARDTCGLRGKNLVAAVKISTVPGV